MPRAEGSPFPGVVVKTNRSRPRPAALRHPPSPLILSMSIHVW